MPRCKNCRNKFEPVRFNQKYCLESECVKVWVDDVKTKDWNKRKAEKKAELMTVQDYVKIAQQVFNKYIRLRDKDKGCISCGKPLVGKFDAGHFYNANNHWYIRFHPDNVHGQCVLCNQHKHGNLLEYRQGLIKRIGYEQVESLGRYAVVTRKFTIEELKEIIETYKAKIKEYEKRK